MALQYRGRRHAGRSSFCREDPTDIGVTAKRVKSDAGRADAINSFPGGPSPVRLTLVPIARRDAVEDGVVSSYIAILSVENNLARRSSPATSARESRCDPRREKGSGRSSRAFATLKIALSRRFARQATARRPR